MAGTGPPNQGIQEQNQGVTTVPFNGQESGSTNPLLDAASAQVQYHSQAMTNAAQVLRNTPMYSTTSGGAPTMPQPSLKSKLFSGASVHNLDNQQPQTRAGARNKALGQVAAMGAGIVGKWVQKKEAEKTQALSQDIHKTLELTEGLDQAKQVLSDGNATPEQKQQAQALQQKNQALLVSLLNGKNGKEIAKAYDVTFGAESQNQSPNDKKDSIHAKAMQDALKQRGIDRAQAFQQQIPEKMQVNPAYQNAYKQYQDQEKALNDAQKNYATAYNKQAEFDKDVKVQEMKSVTSAAVEEGREKTALDVASTRAQAQEYGDRIRANATIQSAKIRASAALEAVKEAKTQQAKMNVGAKMYQEVTKNITDLTQQNTKLQTDLNMAKKDKKQTAAIQSQIDSNNDAIQEYKQEQNLWGLYATDDPQSASALQLLQGLDNE